MHPNPPAYAGTTSAAIRPAKPSRYARVYTGTSPKPVIPDQRGRRFTEWSRREPSDMDGQVARQSERERASQTPYNNSLTSDFSSFSSATDASIFARLKSFIGRPCTISHFPERTRTGNDEINPFSTP